MSVDRFDFRIGIVGEDNSPEKSRQQVTMKEIVAYIRRKHPDAYLQRELLKRVSRYPGNSINRFFDRMDFIVEEIMRTKDESRSKTNYDRQKDIQGEISEETQENR